MARWTYRWGAAALVVVLVVGLCVVTVLGTGSASAAGSVTVARHVGGVVRAVFATSSYLLWGKGAELEVYSPDGANLLGGLLLPALISDIDVDGSTAYVTASDGLYVVNLASPAQPALVRRIAAPPLGEFGMVSTVAAAGGYAYVGLADDGLWVVNLAAASASASADQASFSGTVVQAPDHHFVGKLYHAGSLLLSVDNLSGSPGQPRIWNVSNPAAPVDLGRVNTRSDASGVVVAGSYLFVSTFYQGLAIYNWNPAQPLTATLAGSLPVATGAVDVALSGDGQRALLATDGALALVDVANRAAPVLKDLEPAPVSFYTRLAVQGGRVFAAAGEAALQVYSISTTSLTFTLERGLRGSQLAAAGAGTNVYLAANTQGVERLNATDPASPTLTGRTSLGLGAQAVTTSGSYLAVGAGDQVVVVDPSSLAETGRVAVPDFNQVWALAGAGDNVFVAAGHAGVCSVAIAGGVPKLRTCLDTDGEAKDVALDGTRLYVADSGNGVVVVNAADPDNLQSLGRYTSAFALAVALAGPQLYVSDFNNGDGRLLLLNRGAGAGLNFAAQYNTRGFVNDVETAGDLVYASNEQGLEVLQKSSPNSLMGWAWYDSPGGASDVLLVGGQTYLMDGANGLLVLSVSTPAGTPTPPPGATPTTEPSVGPYRVQLPLVLR
jgi:hypothetical protein